MITESEIRNHIADVASGRMDVHDFVDWLESASWNMHRDSEPGAVKIVGSLEHLFSEYDRGFIKEEDLQTQVLEVANHIEHTFEIGDAAPAKSRSRTLANSAFQGLRLAYSA